MNQLSLFCVIVGLSLLTPVLPVGAEPLADKAIGSDCVYVQPDKDGFLTCGLLWTPGLAVYYCNGREVLRWADPRISDVPSDLMFDMVQGGWDNDAIDDSRLPADFVVDYVRVWQRKDLASPLDTNRPLSATARN